MACIADQRVRQQCFEPGAELRRAALPVGEDAAFFIKAQHLERHRGLLGALELVSDKASKRGFDPALGLPDRIFAAGYENGLVFRSFGDHILGFAPALTYTPSEFEQLFARLRKTLDSVLAAPDVRKAIAG